MKSNSYWEKRSNQHLLDLLQDGDKIHRDLSSAYADAQGNIEKEIASLYGRFAKDNKISQADAVKLIKGQEYRRWRMRMEDYLAAIDAGDEALLLELNVLCMRPRINRLQTLEGEIVANMAMLANRQEKAVGEHLKHCMEQTYYRTMYDHYKDKDPAMLALMARHNVALSKSNIEKMLTLPWSGENYSNAIWKREYDVAAKVKRAVTRSILEGKSIDNLTAEMTEALGSDYKYAAKRLIHTETAYAKGQGDLLTYEKLGVKEYTYLATLDSRTSPPCRRLDGQHFPIADAKPGVNYPPMHPHCRSTTMAYRKPGADKTRVARDADGKIYKVPLGMNYKEWHALYGKPIEIGYKDIKGKKVKLSAKPKSKPKPLPKSKPKPKPKPVPAPKPKPKADGTDKRVVTPKKLDPQKGVDARNYAVYEDACDYLLPLSQDVYKELPRSVIDSIYSYTYFSDKINYKLRSGRFVDGKTDGLDKIDREILDITEALNMFELPEKMKLYRSVNEDGTRGFLNIPDGYQIDMYEAMKRTVGKSFTDKAFISTAVNSKAWFKQGDSVVRYEITAPAGTQGLFVDPLSFFSTNFKTDGKFRHSREDKEPISYNNKGENEFLLQRNTRFLIKKVEKRGNNIYVQMEVEGHGI